MNITNFIGRTYNFTLRYRCDIISFSWRIHKTKFTAMQTYLHLNTKKRISVKKFEKNKTQKEQKTSY